MTTKSKITQLGWTASILRERLSNCRRFQKDFKQWGFSYRVLGVSEYLRLKGMLRILEQTKKDGE